MDLVLVFCRCPFWIATGIPTAVTNILDFLETVQANTCIVQLVLIQSQINPVLAPTSQFLHSLKWQAYIRYFVRCFAKCLSFMAKNCCHFTQHSSWKTSLRRLSATVYSVYSPLLSTSGDRSSSQNVTKCHAVVKGAHLPWNGGRCRI